MASITAVTMPKWGLAMTEGMVASWTVEEGQRVEPGAELLDIETSKITNALESPGGGVLRRRLAQPGVMLPVGALLGVIADPSVPDAEIDAFVEAQQAQAAAVAASAGAAAPEPQTVQVGGRPIRYLRTGPAGGTPVVLVHGFGGDLNNWLFTMPALAEQHGVVALDLPGHGGSTKDLGGGDGSGSPEAMAGLLGEFLTALDIGRAHLVGHSMGGAVALAYALASPARVASLTLLSPAGLGDEIDTAYLDGFVGAQKRKDLKPFLEQLFADPDLVTRDLIEDVLKYKRLDGVDAALRTIRGAFAGARGQTARYRDRLGELKAPVQVIWGSSDRIIPSAHAGGLPSGVAVHLIEGKGHMAHMEAAAEVNRLIERFVAAA